MSRYPFETDAHAIVVGYDGPLDTLFAQGWPRGKEAGGAPDLWIGAAPPYIRTLAELRARLADHGYGPIPPALQAEVLRDLDTERPLAFDQLCRTMVEVCLATPSAQLPQEPAPGPSSYLLLDERGWQLRAWAFATREAAEAELSRLIYGGEPPLPRAEEVASYLTDPSVYLRVNEGGPFLGLPVYAGVRQAAGGAGAFFSGPVACTGDHRGLTPEQVTGCVRAELFYVDAQVRDIVTHLWYRGMLRRRERRRSPSW
jgi:hypothetical protein